MYKCETPPQEVATDSCLYTTLSSKPGPGTPHCSTSPREPPPQAKVLSFRSLGPSMFMQYGLKHHMPSPHPEERKHCSTSPTYISSKVSVCFDVFGHESAGAPRPVHRCCHHLLSDATPTQPDSPLTPPNPPLTDLSHHVHVILISTTGILFQPIPCPSSVLSPLVLHVCSTLSISTQFVVPCAFSNIADSLSVVGSLSPRSSFFLSYQMEFTRRSTRLVA